MSGELLNCVSHAASPPSPKTGAAERGAETGCAVSRGSHLSEGCLGSIPVIVIDQTHLSFQRGQEAWLAGFGLWWGRNNFDMVCFTPFFFYFDFPLAPFQSLQQIRPKLRPHPIPPCRCDDDQLSLPPSMFFGAGHRPIGAYLRLWHEDEVIREHVHDGLGDK